MAEKKPAPIVDPRVARGFQLLQEIADRQAELTKLEQELLAVGAGRYVEKEDGRGCTAVAATSGRTGAPSYALRDGEDEKARTLTGDKFGDLFERKVTYEPKPGFSDRVDVLLTPAKKRDLIALCYVPGKWTAGKSGYVLWK